MKIRKTMRRCSVFIAALMIFMNAVPAQAAEQIYKISFKAGAKGSFADGGTSYTVLRSYKEDISGDVSVATNQIQKSMEGTGYYFTGWSPEVSGLAERRESYTAQYARIINEAVYAVNYVDTYGNPVATQKVISADLNATVTAYAESVEGYQVDAISKSATINEKNGTEITFVYTMIPNIIRETETIVTEGTPGTTTPETETPGTTTPGTEEQGDETIGNEDEDVPFPDVEDEKPPRMEEIEDEEVPLANIHIPHGSMLIYVGVGFLLVLLAAVLLWIWVKRKK